MTARARLLLVAVVVLVPVGWFLFTVTNRAPAMRLVESSPADTQSLASAPEQVQLDLSVAADAALSHLTVTDSEGRRVDAGPVTAGPADVLRLPTKIDRPGDYAISYHVIGVAGGETSGVIRFAVGGPATTDVADASGHEHGVDPLSAGLLLVNLLAVIVVVVLLILRPAPVR